MPIYRYLCSECDHEFKAFRDIDDKVIKCPKCKGILACRLPPRVGISFNGNGFYKTKYRNKEKKLKSNKEE